ncbi:MAG: leucyl aminopeptidase [Brevinematales bacterium]|nr:leucyl aminopeptidase [Brevinematales bacterium]
MDVFVKSFKDFVSQEADALVVFSFENEDIKKVINPTITRLVNEVIKSEGFNSKIGEVVVIPKPALPKNVRFKKIIVIGAEKRDKFNTETIRKLGSVISKNASKYNYSSVLIYANWFSKGVNRSSDKSLPFKALIEGLLLGTYKFEEFISKKESDKKTSLEKAYVLKPNLDIDFDRIADRVKVVVDGVFLARKLQNLPSNVATPTYISQIAKMECEKVGVKVKIIDKKEAEEMGMNLYLAVARGSEEEPKFVIMEYEGGGDKWYGLLGKGITFDTGGISLKPSDRMEEMKFDMSGAAAVIATMVTIAKLKLNVNVVGITPLTENMPSGKATKPGDIVKSMGGIFVEIVNTDAEGRLILADALEYVKKYKPDFVIDIATLTGACVVALGHEAAGLMGNDEKLKQLIKESSERTSERVWELPLWEDYDEYIKSNFADVKNVGNRYAGAITAAVFMKKFVDYPWAHLDIAGVAYTDKEKFYISKGGTGFGVRLFVDMFERIK